MFKSQFAGSQFGRHFTLREKVKRNVEKNTSGRLKLALATLAPSTRTNYRASLRRLAMFLEGDPLTDRTLAEYMLELHQQGKAPRTIAQAVNAAKFKAKGLTLEQVETMIQLAEAAPVERGLRDAALMAVMFYAGLRAGEAGTLRLADFTFYQDGTGSLKIRRSKTDQGGTA